MIIKEILNNEQKQLVANIIVDIEKKDKEIERLKEELKYTIPIVEHNQTIQSNINSYNKLAKYSEELEDTIDTYNKELDKTRLSELDKEYRINKAIEYIEERYNGEVLTHTFDKDNVGELLEILKGSEQE